jgi:PAS domain S-box-containing protein
VEKKLVQPREVILIHSDTPFRIRARLLSAVGELPKVQISLKPGRKNDVKIVRVDQTFIELFLFLGLLACAGVAIWLGRQYARSKKKQTRLYSDFIKQKFQIDQLQIYKTIVQESPNLFVIVDTSLQIIVANKAADKFGWKIHQPFSTEQILGAVNCDVESELSRVAREGISLEGEVRLEEEEGVIRHFIYHIIPVRDLEGRSVAAAISAADITAERTAEQELRQQQQFIEEIMNALPDAVYVKDDNRKYIYVNRVFADLIGKTTQDFLGKTDSEVLSQAQTQTFLKSDQLVLRSGFAIEFEDDFETEKGRRTFATRRIPFFVQNGTRAMIAIMRDFTEKKRLENELQISKSRQEEASRLATMGEMAGGIAHEINNPLNVLVGVAELVKAKVQMDGSIEKEKLLDFCDRLIKYSMRIAKIVRGMRAIARDASRDPFETVSLTDVLDETLELCRQQFQHRGIELKVNYVRPTVKVAGRPAQVSQVLMNMINNARDAVDGVSQPCIHLEVGVAGAMGYVRVWDNGKGVPLELEIKIMRPFFTTKPPGKGTGLGLSISKTLALEHNGDIFLNRKVADSCFELHLPLAVRQIHKKSA